MRRRLDPVPDPFAGRHGRVQEPKRMETGSTTTRPELQRRDRVRVFLAAVGQAIPDATPTTLNWTGEVFDEAGMHSTVVNNSRLTVYQADAAAFAWDFSAQIVWDANATGYRRVEIVRNGAVSNEADSVIPAGVIAPHAQHVRVLVNDVVPGHYFEVRVTQTSGGILNVQGGFTNLCSFQAIALW